MERPQAVKELKEMLASAGMVVTISDEALDKFGTDFESMMNKHLIDQMPEDMRTQTAGTVEDVGNETAKLIMATLAAMDFVNDAKRGAAIALSLASAALKGSKQ